MVKERYNTIRELLGKLKDREEWTVRATVDRGKLQEVAGAEDREIQRLQASIERLPSGTAYLLNERLKLLKEEAVQRAIDGMIQEIYAQIMIHAEASATAEPVRGATDLESKELVFQMAFLVPKERMPGFTQAVLQEARRRHAQGFEIQQVGPFPPYYFCNLELTPPPALSAEGGSAPGGPLPPTPGSEAESGGGRKSGGGVKECQAHE